MTMRRIGSVSLPLLTLASFVITGCGARVALEDGPNGTATDSATSTGVASSTYTGSSTPYTGSTTSYQTATPGYTVYGTGTSYGTSTYAYTQTVTGSSPGYTGYATSTSIIYTGTGTGVYTGSSIGTGVYTASVIHTYTSTGTAYTTSTGCNGVPLTMLPGMLTVASGYVTTGVLKGYAYTWTNATSSGTCISPTCGTTGCTPAFPTTSVCAAGEVAADVTYNTAVGVGFNLNQDVTGGALGSVAAPQYITVNAAMPLGGGFTRVQLSGADGLYYCVDAGKWASGLTIPITAFDTSCWDGTGKMLMPGMPITAINLLFPSDATAYRPFSACLLGVSFSVLLN